MHNLPPARAPRAAPRLLRRAAPALLLCAAGAALLALPAHAAPPAPSPESVKLVEEANRKVRQRDLQAAFELLRRAIAADANNVDAHIRYQDLAYEALGSAQLQGSYSEAAKKKPDDAVMQFLAARLLPPPQAIEEFQRQTKVFTTSPWPWAGLARALEDAGRSADAVVAHADAVQRAGEEASRFLAYRAYGFERTHQWDAAIEAWKAVVDKTPADLSARYGLAEALRHGGRPVEALAALDAAGKAGATDAELAYRRGLVHVDVRRWDDALAEFDKAIGQDKGMVEAFCAASEAARHRAYDVATKEGRALEAKDLDRAVAYGERAVVAFGDSPYAYYVLGAANEAQGEFDGARLDEALRAYDQALERLPIPGPEKVRVLAAKAWVQILKANWDAALEAAQRAIDMEKVLPDKSVVVVAYGHAGYALCALGKQKDAIDKYYRPALKLDPNAARIHHDLGVALWESKKATEARKPLEDARNLEPENGRYRVTLGELNYHLRRYKEAVAELTKATELLPRDIPAWRSFGRACYSAKNWPECVRSYEKTIELDRESIYEHLILAVVYSEQLKDKTKAKAHATKFREKGGQDPNLDDWLNTLLATETK